MRFWSLVPFLLVGLSMGLGLLYGRWRRRVAQQWTANRLHLWKLRLRNQRLQHEEPALDAVVQQANTELYQRVRGVLQRLLRPSPN